MYVRMLGGFGVSADARAVSDDAWRLRKAKSLVKLLALTPEHRLHRDQVIELFWPDHDPASTANNLHQVLHVARRALASTGTASPGVLALRDDVVILSPLDGVETDVEQFEALAEHARQTGAEHDIDAAVRAYTGELLPEDRYEDWVAPRRHALHESYVRLLVALAEVRTKRGEADTAIDLLRNAIAQDELYEPAHRALIRLYAATGRRSHALVQYARLRDALQAEYGADPDPDTQRLYLELTSSSGEEARVGALTAGKPAQPSQVTAQHRRRHNLPRQLTSFIGRERELVELSRMLARVQLLTLTGPGGSGKTRLAQELAARHVRSFPDGAWLVELAALSESSLLPDAVASALDLQPPAAGVPLRAIAAQLAGRRLLLVLDNCEHLIDACSALVVGLLRSCPGMVLLATSREPLRIPGETTWRVSSLTLPDLAVAVDAAKLAHVASIRLFTERAQDVQPGFRLDHESAPAVAEICSRLDGMPLPIELAAARTTLLSPRQIAERLVDALAVLSSGSRAGLTRHQTLRATLAWSHDLLDGPEQALFRRLAVFAGSFPLEAVEGTCSDSSVPPSDVLAVLGRLVDKSLVIAEPHVEAVRYRLLETVRQYARELLGEASEVEAFAGRHCSWFLDFARAHDPERASGVVSERPQLLDVEHDNLRVALAWAVVNRPEAALELASSLWRFWLARGHFAEGRRWLKSALRAAPEPTGQRARAFWALLVLEVRLGIQSNIERISREAVEIARRLGDPAELAQALHLRALFTWMRYDFDAATAVAHEALRLAGQHSLPTVEAAAIHVLALVALAREDADEARARLYEVLDLLTNLGDVDRPFFTAVTPAFVTEELPDGRTVIALEETKLLGRRVGPAQARAYVLDLLGNAARIGQDLDQAREHVQRSLQLFDDLDDVAGVALALNHLGCIQRLRHAYDEGRHCLEHSLQLRTELGDRRAIALTQVNLAQLEAAAGDLTGARTRLGDALETFEATEDGPGTCGTLLALGIVAIRADDVAAARAALQRSRTGFLSQEILGPAAWIGTMLADLADDTGDPLVGQELRHEAETVFDRLGMDRARAYTRTRRTVAGRSARPPSPGR